MTITDSREPVYVRKGNRYIAIGSLNDPYKYDSFCCEGLWLHTRTKYGQNMTLIAELKDLPCSAVAFASVMQHHEELRGVIQDNQGKSMNDTAKEILKWIATKSNQ